MVHLAHGIGRYRGLALLEKDGASEEHLGIEFDGGTKIYVPATRIGLIQKYVGGFQGTPQLSRLGSGAWEKQKAKVSEAVMDMAAELLEVQAARAAQQLGGHFRRAWLVIDDQQPCGHATYPSRKLTGSGFLEETLNVR